MNRTHKSALGDVLLERHITVCYHVDAVMELAWYTCTWQILFCDYTVFGNLNVAKVA